MGKKIILKASCDAIDFIFLIAHQAAHILLTT